MIKRIIASTLSAVLCSSAASTGLSSNMIHAISSHDLTNMHVAIDENGKSEEITTQTTAATTLTTTGTPTEVTTVKTEASAETTTVSSTEVIMPDEPSSTIVLGENISAEIYDNGYVHIKGYGEMKEFDNSPFKDMEIKQVFIENEDPSKDLVITSLGKNLFNGCDTLLAVSDKTEFTDETIILPDSIKNICDSALLGCSKIKNIRLDGVETIGQYALAGCTGIKSLVIPENVTSMGRMLLSGCTELEELSLPYASTDAICSTVDGDLNPDKSVTDLFYDQHWAWENDAFDSSQYKLTKIIITGGEKVPKYAFSNFNCLTEIDLSGAPISAIGEYAFNDCTGLKEIKLPSTLKTIDKAVFRNCTSMKEFKLVDGLECVGPYCFENCTGINSLTIPMTVTSMGRMMLLGCTELEELILPYAATDASCAETAGDTNPDRSVADLFIDQHWNWENDEMDFSPYKLTKITIKGGDKVPRNAFAGMTGIKEINLSETKITAIDAYAFYKCSVLTNIKIPETLTDIGNYAYYATPITSLPDNGKIKNLGDGVFAYCTKLEITTLPESYESIGQYGFCNCTGIKTLVIPANVKSMGRMLLLDCTELTELTLPYAATNEDCAVIDGSTNPDQSVTDLFVDQHWNWANDAFNPSKYKLTKLTITGGEKIPKNAFASLKCLNEIDLSETAITQIDEYAFYDCTNLTEIKLPKTLKMVGVGTFCNCTSMKEFKLVDGMEAIDQYAFANCTGISSLVIPDTVTSMGRMMVNGCLALETLQIPYAATDASAAEAEGAVNPDHSVADLFIDQHWNWGNDEMDFTRYGISKIIITGGEKIPRYAFSNMSTLREVDICGTATTRIDEYAFNNCSALISAEIPESIATIKGNAFSGTNTDLYIYGKECVIEDKSLNDEYSGTIHGYKESTAKEYADANEFKFEQLDGEIVISPKVLSMAIGDKYTIKAGIEGVTFSSSDEAVVTVDERGVIRAAAEGTATVVASIADGKSVSIDVTVRPRVPIYTLGDVNEDGKIDAKDASLILKEYALASTNSPSELDEKQKAAADVNADGSISAIDASSILAYYAYISTNEEAVSLEDYLKKSE